MPSFNHQTARCDNWPAPVVANGEPLSVFRTAEGQVHGRETPRLKPRPHAVFTGGATMRQHKTNLLHASATVSGSHRV